MMSEKRVREYETAMAVDVLCDAVALIESGRVSKALESIAWALQLLPDVGREEQQRLVGRRKKARFGS